MDISDGIIINTTLEVLSYVYSVSLSDGVDSLTDDIVQFIYRCRNQLERNLTPSYEQYIPSITFLLAVIADEMIIKSKIPNAQLIEFLIFKTRHASEIINKNINDIKIENTPYGILFVYYTLLEMGFSGNMGQKQYTSIKNTIYSYLEAKITLNHQIPKAISVNINNNHITNISSILFGMFAIKALIICVMSYVLYFKACSI